MRFLVDTNILISAALFPDGAVSRVLSYILESHEVVISSFSLDEARKVLLRKFPDKLNAFEKFISEIEFMLFQTPPSLDTSAYPNLRDANDLPILASAILSGADILLTGDKDFLEIQIEKPLIFTPREYLDLIEKSSL